MYDTMIDVKNYSVKMVRKSYLLELCIHFDLNSFYKLHEMIKGHVTEIKNVQFSLIIFPFQL